MIIEINILVSENVWRSGSDKVSALDVQAFSDRKEKLRATRKYSIHTENWISFMLNILHFSISRNNGFSLQTRSHSLQLHSPWRPSPPTFAFLLYFLYLRKNNYTIHSIITSSNYINYNHLIILSVSFHYITYLNI